jgi:hypothetical protein
MPTGPRLQFNTISSLIDGNFVYGTTKEVVDALRTYKGGFLKTLPVFQEFGLKDLLPLKTTDPDDGCLRPQRDIYCFLAGDNRVNEQLVLAVVHTIFVREHNRLVYELHRINPHWDDETLYQVQNVEVFSPHYQPVPGMVVQKLFRIAFAVALFVKAANFDLIIALHCTFLHRICISHSHRTFWRFFFVFSHFFHHFGRCFMVNAPKSCEKCEKNAQNMQKELQKCEKKNAKCKCDAIIKSKFASHRTTVRILFHIWQFFASHSHGTTIPGLCIYLFQIFFSFKLLVKNEDSFLQLFYDTTVFHYLLKFMCQFF